MTITTTVPAGYFERMYQQSADPWGFDSRWYEQRKRAICLAMLPQRRYLDAFEPACSIGSLTEMLAGRCDRLLACDLAGAAVASASLRLRAFPGVRVQRRALPTDWPDGSYDLIVLSELLYYFNDRDLAEIMHRTCGSLREGGTLLAVHWRHPVADHPRSGDDVHAVLDRQPGFARLARHCEDDFAAEVYVRTEGRARSVAMATGLL